MARLLVHVEGPTEEAFVNEILRDYLVHVGYESVDARIIGNARLRRRRGGIRAWPAVRDDIARHLRYDSGCIATTLVDYYGLPHLESAAWPGRRRAAQLPFNKKAGCVEQALFDDLAGKGISQLFKRFVPFVVMHEFEGLLFSDCAAFSHGIGRPELEKHFRQIREQFETPEEINDSPETSPSKRVENLVPGYQKPLLGILAVLEIGLTRIRSECPHFNEWIQKLESLA
jgi:hypothetical protein